MKTSVQTVQWRRQSVRDSAESLERILRLLAHRLELRPSAVVAALGKQCSQSTDELRKDISAPASREANDRLLRTMHRSIDLALKATKLLQRDYQGPLLQRAVRFVFRRRAAAGAAALASQVAGQLEKQRQALKSIKPSMLEVRHGLPVPLLL